jgi:hypothetical protein
VPQGREPNQSAHTLAAPGPESAGANGDDGLNVATALLLTFITLPAFSVWKTEAPFPGPLPYTGRQDSNLQPPVLEVRGVLPVRVVVVFLGRSTHLRSAEVRSVEPRTSTPTRSKRWRRSVPGPFEPASADDFTVPAGVLVEEIDDPGPFHARGMSVDLTVRR